MSGHILELDDTPGAERISVYHKSGTNIEMDAVGNIVHKINGTSFLVVDKDNNVYIRGNQNITVEGNATLYTKSDLTMKVDGDLTQTVHGDYNLNVAGKTSINSGESLKLRGAMIGIEGYMNDIQVYAKNEIRQYSGGDFHVVSAGEIFEKGIEINHVSTGSYLISATTFDVSSTGVKMSGGLDVTGGATVSGAINLDGDVEAKNIQAITVKSTFSPGSGNPSSAASPSVAEDAKLATRTKLDVPPQPKIPMQKNVITHIPIVKTSRDEIEEA